MKNSTIKNRIIRLLTCLFWLTAWEIASIVVGNEILLVSPLRTAARLLELSGSPRFWSTAGLSFARIMAGFSLAAAAGTIMAGFSAWKGAVHEFIRPVISVVKSTPVASFTILALVWVSPRSLSAFVSFLMVLPIFYTNVYNGIMSADKKLIEMADVFHIRAVGRVRAIYAPAALPHLLSACTVGFGFAWKSGIAAEVIGLPRGTIGMALYSAKIYLETADLFAWTAVIIILSALIEHAIVRLVGKAGAR